MAVNDPRDGTFHELEDESALDANNYAGTKSYPTKAVQTNTDIGKELTNVLADFISEVRKEFKAALQELEDTRNAINTNNKSLLRTLKTLPMSEDRRAIRNWAMKDEQQAQAPTATPTTTHEKQARPMFPQQDATTIIAISRSQ